VGYAKLNHQSTNESMRISEGAGYPGRLHACHAPQTALSLIRNSSVSPLTTKNMDT